MRSTIATNLDAAAAVLLLELGRKKMERTSEEEDDVTKGCDDVSVVVVEKNSDL